MPNIKPINKLVSKARNLRDHHRERHTPSGFAFALADSIDYLDQAHWQKVTPHDSLFFSPRYLRGARPEPMRVWIRHRIPMMNHIVRRLLHTIDDHEEPPQRNPFK